MYNHNDYGTMSELAKIINNYPERLEYSEYCFNSYLVIGNVKFTIFNCFLHANFIIIIYVLRLLSTYYFKTKVGVVDDLCNKYYCIEFVIYHTHFIFI